MRDFSCLFWFLFGHKLLQKRINWGSSKQASEQASKPRQARKKVNYKQTTSKANHWQGLTGDWIGSFSTRWRQLVINLAGMWAFYKKTITPGVGLRLLGFIFVFLQLNTPSPAKLISEHGRIYQGAFLLYFDWHQRFAGPPPFVKGGFCTLFWDISPLLPDPYNARMTHQWAITFEHDSTIYTNIKNHTLFGDASLYSFSRWPKKYIVCSRLSPSGNFDSVIITTAVKEQWFYLHN